MAGHRTIVKLLFSVGILFQGCDSDVRCRNDEGNEVDWYFLYKFPGGLHYLYMDENTYGWKLSTKEINSSSGTLANTLKPLLDFYTRRTEHFGYMLYNDQPPNSKSVASSYGHSKGVVMLDRQTGVWLSHSTPKFPTYREKDFWPDNGKVNAQTFLCVTYRYDEFKEIGLQLRCIHAYSFDSDIPMTFHTELKSVAQRDRATKKTPLFRVKMLTSLEGHRFQSFAKYGRFGDDLYSGLIVNHSTKDLCVKSWGKSRSHPLPSNHSTKHRVYNVKKIKLLKSQEPFSDNVDHSKWCVTPSRGLTCIADTNREVSQMKRGGGAICTKDAEVRKAFFKLIPPSEPCHEQKRESLVSDTLMTIITIISVRMIIIIIMLIIISIMMIIRIIIRMMMIINSIYIALLAGLKDALHKEKQK